MSSSQSIFIYGNNSLNIYLNIFGDSHHPRLGLKPGDDKFRLNGFLTNYENVLIKTRSRNISQVSFLKKKFLGFFQRFLMDNLFRRKLFYELKVQILILFNI